MVDREISVDAPTPGPSPAPSRDDDAVVDDADRLTAVADALASLGDHQSEFDELLTLATRLLDTPVGLVSLVEADRQRFVAERGFHEPAGGTPLSHSFCRFVVEDHAPLVIPDARADPRVRDNPAIDDLGVAAYCGVPIVDDDGHVLGSLCAIDRQPHEWSDANVEVLEVLARGIGARMSIEGRHRTLVGAIQERVARVPDPPGRWDVDAVYQPAHGSAVGGDFYDIVEHDEGGLSIVLADVVGHGIDATIAMAQLQAAARTVLALEPDLSTGAERLDVAAAQIPGVPFAALTLAAIDATGSHLEHLCCGALPPLLVRPDGSGELLDGGQSLPISLRGPRQTAHTELDDWAALVLYTDGLIERRGENLDVGLHRLIEHAHLAGAANPAATLVAALAERSDDDVAVVVVRPRT